MSTLALIFNFEGLDTLGFLYYDAKSGAVVAPEFRHYDMAQTSKLSFTFRSFYENYM